MKMTGNVVLSPDFNKDNRYSNDSANDVYKRTDIYINNY